MGNTQKRKKNTVSLPAKVHSPPGSRMIKWFPFVIFKKFFDRDLKSILNSELNTLKKQLH